MTARRGARASAVGLLILAAALAAAAVWPARRPGGGRAARAVPPGTAALPSPARSPSPLVARSPTFDFGTAIAGRVVRHVFHLQNTSSAPLTVERVAVSCSCTRATCLPNHVPPHGRARVFVAYLPPFDLRGAYHDWKQATVYVAGVDAPCAVLTLSGMVSCPILADTSGLTFPGAMSGGPAVARVVLHLDAHSRIRVVSAHATSRRLFCRVGMPFKSAGGFRSQYLTVKVSPRSLPGPFDCNVILDVSGGDVRSLTIPVSGMVTGAISSEPQAAFLGEVARGDGAGVRCWLRQTRRRTIYLAAVRSENRYVHAQLGPSGRITDVAITLGRDAPAGEIRTSVDVLERGGRVALTIPVYAYVN